MTDFGYIDPAKRVHEQQALRRAGQPQQPQQYSLPELPEPIAPPIGRPDYPVPYSAGDGAAHAVAVFAAIVLAVAGAAAIIEKRVRRYLAARRTR